MCQQATLSSQLCLHMLAVQMYNWLVLLLAYYVRRQYRLSSYVLITYTSPEKGRHNHIMATVIEIPSSGSLDTNYTNGSIKFIDEVTIGVMGT